MRLLLLCLVLTLTGCAGGYNVCPSNTAPSAILNQCAVMPKCVQHCEAIINVEQANQGATAVPPAPAEPTPD